MEKDCTWSFRLEGGTDIGPNDPLHITFKGNAYYSIVREAIQNSLDAVNDPEKPVTVSFQYFELNRQEYPEFFKIETHIEQSLQYFEKNEDAKRLFEDMLRYLNGAEDSSKVSKISCLKISDSNTKGMHFDEGTSSPFYAFLRASGVSSKNTGSGGSFGFGKGAYFALSPIKTVIVSSKDVTDKVFFEGATRLTTHKNNEDEKISAYGFYDNNSGNPTVEEEMIPEIFLREEAGTDVNIMGLWPSQDQKKLMIKSVLNNFWLAIYKQSLIVKIDDVTIDKDNVETIIDEYFEGQAESGSYSNIEEWNPKSYLKAVKYADTNDQFKFFEEELPTVGKVQLFVYLENGLPNRISYFRRPKMVVYKKTVNKINGYSAVFICEDEQGNRLLRLMENPAHNEWNKDNFPKQKGQLDSVATEALKEIKTFVNKILDSLAQVKVGSKITFMDLEEFLSIPEELLEKEEQFDQDGMNTNNSVGNPASDQTETETGMVTTDLGDGSMTIKPTVKTSETTVQEYGSSVKEDGEREVGTGGANDTDGGDTSSDVEEGNNKSESGATDEEAPKSLLKISYKVAAQIESDILYHYLILKSDREVENAEISLLVAGDNDREEGIKIMESDVGAFYDNKITHLKFEKGSTKIKLRFADKIKHSVKIRAYEI